MMLTPLNPRPRAVLFDLDRTLADYDTARLSRFRHALTPHVPAADLAQAIAAAAEEPGDGGSQLERVLAEHGVRDAAAVADTIQRFQSDRYRDLRLFPEAWEVVERVATVAAVGLVTNGPTDIQRPKIDLLGIAPLFPVIVVSEEVGAWKPDPAIFAIALERMGFVADDAIYVGDSAEHDVPGALAAGLRAVWVSRDRADWRDIHGNPPHGVVHDLWDVLTLLGLPRDEPKATGEVPA